MSNWRRWLRPSTWQSWLRSKRHPRAAETEDESFSDGSNVLTQTSAETPLTSVSRGTSMNVIRDPYSTTPVRYKTAAAAGSSADRSRRTLFSSKSLTAADGPQMQQQQSATPLLSAGDKDNAGANPQLASSRSHSADSVFTIVIRLPRDDSTADGDDRASIRMMAVPQPAPDTDQTKRSEPTTARSRPHATQANHHHHHQQQQQQQQQRHQNPPALRSKSAPIGRPSILRNRPPSHANSHAAAASSSSGGGGSSSLLCGTNNLSLGKLTSLSSSKPNHLPLLKGKLKNNNASPWVPRSCMPVAQSPLLVRCPRFDNNSGGGGSSSSSDVGGVISADSVGLPLDTKIIPKPLANRNLSVGVVGVGGGVGSGPAASGVEASASASASAAGGGALPTVSASVASFNSDGTVTDPPRRTLNHIYTARAAEAAALAAKKAAKKPKKKNAEKKQERKAAKTLSAILLAFIITWTPYNVIVLIKSLADCGDDDKCLPSALWNFAYYLCYINSTVNPVCYALCNASFRRTYVRILTCKWHSRTKTAVQRGFYN